MWHQILDGIGTFEGHREGIIMEHFVAIHISHVGPSWCGVSDVITGLGVLVSCSSKLRDHQPPANRHLSSFFCKIYLVNFSWSRKSEGRKLSLRWEQPHCVGTSAICLFWSAKKVEVRAPLHPLS